MKQLFFFDKGEHVNTDVLAIQIGEKHLAYAITDQPGKDLKQLAWCIADDRNLGWNENELSEIIYHYPVLRNSIRKINISYQITDADWKAEYYFYLPQHIKKFTEYFHSASFQRQYHVMSDRIEKETASEKLLVDFRNEEFAVIGYSGKNLLLAQTYKYEKPEDVLYYLLRICRHFLFRQESVNIELSGLIEKQSGLYKELYQYFNNISFREALWVTDTGHPGHFFTSLNDLAVCAS